MRISDWSSDVCSSDLAPKGLLDSLGGGASIDGTGIARIGRRSIAGEALLRQLLAYDDAGAVAQLGGQVAHNGREGLRGGEGPRDLAPHFREGLRLARFRKADIQDRKSTRLNSSH